MSTPTTTTLYQARAKYAAMAREQPRKWPVAVHTTYTSLPVPIPDEFLAPLLDPACIKVSRIDFEKSPLPEYKRCFAVVLDNVLSQAECDEFIKYAEMSTGAHGNLVASSATSNSAAENENSEAEGNVEGPPDNGWKPAMVNAGRNHEVLDINYRNSDRIIWDEKKVTARLWARVMQGEGMKEYFSVLEGKDYVRAIGPSALVGDHRWVVTAQGLNERMRFLRYGMGQYFKRHCDGTYETPSGDQRSYYTYHIYLNDSAQALGIPEGSPQDDPTMLRGGATTFWSNMGKDARLDVDPKAGRVLVFQHRGLLHSGDEVTRGIKYTVRSDVMFEWQGNEGVDDGEVIFE